MKSDRTDTPEYILTAVIQVIAMLMLGVLVVMSATGTCVVYGEKEHVQYLNDFPMKHILCGAAVLGAAFLFARCRKKQNAVTKKKHKMTAPELITILAAAAAGVLWLIFVPSSSTADSRRCMEAAEMFLNGDYAPWEPVPFQYSGTISGYASTYPSQNGLILYMIGLIRIFGKANARIAFRVINIGALLAGTWCLTKFLGRKCGTWVILLLYLPFSLYITFVYGTMPGFALSMGSLLAAKQFLRDRKFRYALLCAVLIACAVEMKSNYLIVLIALIIYLLGEALLCRKPAPVLAALLAVASVWAAGTGVTAYFEKTTGYSCDKGIPMIAWVEMGLQEGTRADGWYNRYNIDVYKMNEGDPQQTAEQVKQDLQQTLTSFREDPAYAAEFMCQKTRSQWTEPTFQSLWIQRDAAKKKYRTDFSQSLICQGGRLNDLFVNVTDLLQSLVYEGALLYFILDFRGRYSLQRVRRRRTGFLWESRIPAVIFIGGFLFHLVWEAKSQYTVVYFLLLIPYAVAGFRYARWFLAECGRKKDSLPS